MKIAIQHHLIPGQTLSERFQRAAEYGLDGVELTARTLPRPFAEEHEAIREAMRASGLPVSSLCTMPDDDFVHPDLEERTRRVGKLAALLRFADSIGAAGLVGVPIRPPLALPDLSPWADARTVADELTTRILVQVMAETAGTQARVFLEPLNRYEAKYLTTVGHAADLCRTVGNPRVQVMADLFHMSIEEANLAASLRQAAGHVGHVHLADSNRHLPGHGHTDFAAPFRALAEAQFSGWLAFECSVTGEPNETIPASVRFLREVWSQAQEAAQA